MKQVAAIARAKLRMAIHLIAGVQHESKLKVGEIGRAHV